VASARCRSVQAAPACLETAQCSWNRALIIDSTPMSVIWKEHLGADAARRGQPAGVAVAGGRSMTASTAVDHGSSTNVTIWAAQGGASANFLLAEPADGVGPCFWRPGPRCSSRSYQNALLARTRCSAAFVLSTPTLESMNSRRPSVEIPTTSAWLAPSL
jgi:hypothetical protein